MDPGWTESLQAAFAGGVNALDQYFLGKVFGAFVPAFFLAGAIGTWIPKAAVVKYLSPRAPKHVAYAVATTAGGLLSVCACGILPLFAAIYSRGAGIGPAITFLFAGPAINLIAIYYTFDLLGPGMGWARILSVAVLSVLVGLVFTAVVGDAEGAGEARPETAGKAVDLSADTPRQTWQTVFPMFFMAAATVILPLEFQAGGRWFAMQGGSARFFGEEAAVRAARASFALKMLLVAICVGLVIFAVWRWFTKRERDAWLGKTWDLLKNIVPKIVLGIFFTGVLEVYMDRAALVEWVGTNSLSANLVASVAGGVLYFGTIVGVIVANFFRMMGMAEGPLLALLIAGPTVTLPSVFAITGIIGIRRALGYFALVVAVATFTGLGYGML